MFRREGSTYIAELIDQHKNWPEDIELHLMIGGVADPYRA